MKYLFLLIFILLSAASVWVMLQMPEGATRRTAIVYWTTDPNPARFEQVRLFDTWQVRHGLVDDTGEPLVELRLDVGNADLTKKVVQSVSGVAGDVMDLNHGSQMRFFRQMAVLQDVTEAAQLLGYGPDSTFAGVKDEISVVGFDGQRRQYMYPANIAFTMPMVNLDMFRRLGMEPPQGTWTFEEFEKVGREFVRRANAPDSGLDPIAGRRFFIDNLAPLVLHRSLGVDTYNETLTDVNHDTPEFIRVHRLLRDWTYRYRLIPSNADRSAMQSSGGYGGGGAEGFEIGRNGLFAGGRWHLIRFRQTNQTRIARGQQPLEIGLSEFPHGGFRNVEIGVRSTGVYIDGNRMRRDVAFTHDDGRVVTLAAGTPWGVLFQAFLASEEYNDQIIADGDGLPPNPAFTQSSAFLIPDEDAAQGIYPTTEHALHGGYLEAAEHLAIPRTNSPFILLDEANRIEDAARGRYLAQPPIPGYETPEAAMWDAATRIRERMNTILNGQPDLREEHNRALADQQEIDRLKAAGEPIPERLIRNPFYIAYYRETGQLLEDGRGGPRTPDAPPTGATGGEASAARSAAAEVPAAREAAARQEAESPAAADPVREMIRDGVQAPVAPATPPLPATRPVSPAVTPEREPQDEPAEEPVQAAPATQPQVTPAASSVTRRPAATRPAPQPSAPATRPAT